MSLKDQTVVIIGGNSGVGLATAQMIVADGGQVIIAGRSTRKLEQAQKIIGKNVKSYVLDVTREDQVQSFFAQIADFNHLVTCVGVGGMGTFLEMETRAARSLFDCKFWGQYYAAKYGTPKIKKGGSITFFSGIASRKPFQGLAPVAAINGAIDGLCRTLAIELSPIRVNVVAPGVIDTPAFDNMPESKKASFFNSIATKLPVKRVGKPEDVAQFVMFLIQNSYATGTVFDIDGGHRLV